MYKMYNILKYGITITRFSKNGNVPKVNEPLIKEERGVHNSCLSNIKILNGIPLGSKAL